MDRLTLDSSGGAALFGPCGNADDGRRLTLSEPHLRALDIHGDRQLEVIDLSGCRTDASLHLQLSELPVLRRVYLPAGGEGAVVHLFALALPPNLEIHGAVAELDADWQAGTFSVRAPQRAWLSARLLGQDALAEDLASNAGAEGSLAVVMNPRVLPTELTLAGDMQWLVANAARVTRCTVAGPPRVRLDDAVSLEALTLSGADKVEVRRAAVLEHADRLALHHCRYLEDVSLADDQAVDCYCSVPAPLLHRARFVIDEATLGQTLTRVEDGETDLLDGLLDAIAWGETPHAVFHSLTSLCRLAEKALTPSACGSAAVP